MPSFLGDISTGSTIYIHGDITSKKRSGLETSIFEKSTAEVSILATVFRAVGVVKLPESASWMGFHASLGSGGEIESGCLDPDDLNSVEA